MMGNVFSPPIEPKPDSIFKRFTLCINKPRFAPKFKWKHNL